MARTTVPVDSQKLASFAGTYHIPLPDSITLWVLAGQGKLFLALPGADTATLYAENDSTFFNSDLPPVVFTTGRITIGGSYHGAKVTSPSAR